MAPKPLNDPVNDIERQIMTICAKSGDMVYLIDITTLIAGLPKTLSGQWFDKSLLDPYQTEAHKDAVKAVNRAIKRLFNIGWLDVGAEGEFEEGFRARHERIWQAVTRESYWTAKPKTSDAEKETLADFHNTWRNVPDVAAAKRQLGVAPDRVAITEMGSKAEKKWAGDNPDG